MGEGRSKRGHLGAPYGPLGDTQLLRKMRLSRGGGRGYLGFKSFPSVKLFYINCNLFASTSRVCILLLLFSFPCELRVQAALHMGAVGGVCGLWLISKELPNLPLLERVSLQSNRLEEWNSEIFQNCPKICELYLSHNNLPSPPPEICQLVSVCTLHSTDGCSAFPLSPCTHAPHLS